MDNSNVLSGLGQQLCCVLNGLKINSEPVFTLKCTSSRIYLDIVWTTGDQAQVLVPKESAATPPKEPEVKSSTEKPRAAKRKSPSTRRRDKRRREAWLARKKTGAATNPAVVTSTRNSDAGSKETKEINEAVTTSIWNTNAGPKETKEINDPQLHPKSSAVKERDISMETTPIHFDEDVDSDSGDETFIETTPIPSDEETDSYSGDDTFIEPPPVLWHSSFQQWHSNFK